MKGSTFPYLFSVFPCLFSSAFLIIAGLAFYSFRPIPGSNRHETGAEPWKPSQLISPADLAGTINDPKAPQPLIFCIGPGAVIKGSVDIGSTKDSANLVKFRQRLNSLPKNAPIVIYCGCCPFEHCPNIRPAFTLLNDMKFTQQKLLDLEHNIKTDWINKGYPVVSAP